MYPAYKLPPYSNEVSLEKALEHVVGSKPLLRDAITYFFTPEVGAAIKHALTVKAEYFDQFPAMKPFLDDVKRTAKTRGWIRNFYGRKYYFANPDRENYKAPNYLIQGGCSGICKERGVVVDNFLLENRKSEWTYTFLPIHDEFCFQFHEDDYDLILKTNEILSDLPFRVPITAGMDWGMNLHDKSDIIGQEDIDKLPRAW